MDCTDSFRIFILRKKTSNLISEKIRKFEVLIIEFLKDIFSWVSLIFCVRKYFVTEGIKTAIFEIYLVRECSETSLHLK